MDTPLSDSKTEYAVVAEYTCDEVRQAAVGAFMLLLASPLPELKLQAAKALAEMTRYWRPDKP